MKSSRPTAEDIFKGKCILGCSFVVVWGAVLLIIYLAFK